jgi:hypothetical protein
LPVTPSFLGSNFPLYALFSSTLSLRASLNVNDQVSHPYKATTVKIYALNNKCHMSSSKVQLTFKRRSAGRFI